MFLIGEVCGASRLRQAVTTNPQKSADAIVVCGLKLVAAYEGQNLTTRAKLYFTR